VPIKAVMYLKKKRLPRHIFDKKQSSPTSIDLERTSNPGDFNLAWSKVHKRITAGA
jgi:hypothetical protein